MRMGLLSEPADRAVVRLAVDQLLPRVRECLHGPSLLTVRRRTGRERLRPAQATYQGQPEEEQQSEDQEWDPSHDEAT
jgi:hypothetical protein